MNNQLNVLFSAAAGVLGHRPRIAILLFTAMAVLGSDGFAVDNGTFAGAVSSATPQATDAGIEILEGGGNAIDAAIAVSLALGVSEPAGSGIAGQTVMLAWKPGAAPFVIHGTTWSPRKLPADATREQLVYGRTAAAVPSTMRVLGLAHERFGSGVVDWARLVEPAITIAREGFEIGPFRAHAFRHYQDLLRKQPEAAAIFLAPDGRPWQEGERFTQPRLAVTLERLAAAGAMDFYTGELADAIATDMIDHGGWITAQDLAEFPEPRIVAPLRGEYRGHDVLTLPPPFGGWVVLQILNVLSEFPQAALSTPSAERNLALIDALAVGHGARRASPVRDYAAADATVGGRTDPAAAAEGLARWRSEWPGGETTHFTVIDGDGMVVTVTQSIDSYFGARVVHPELGFLYNNYMQGFQVEDPQAPYYLETRQMPKSSMSASILLRDGKPVMALGSPGSARIISAVAQVSSYWIDVERDIKAATGAYRVHVVPPGRAYVEGESVEPELMAGLANRGLTLRRPTYGVSDRQLDPYFGGVHALALENGQWTGAADPRRDGTVRLAWRKQP